MTPSYDPSDFDTVEAVAEVAAPIFALHGWKYGGEVPDASRLGQTIRHLYALHGEEDLELASTGRFVLVDENPHDGTPVLHEGIRVFLDLGELPPLRGDEDGAAQ